MTDPQEALPEILEELHLLMACVYTALGNHGILDDIILRQVLSDALTSSMHTLKKNGLDHLQWARRFREDVRKGSKVEKDLTSTINMLAEWIG